MSNEKTFPGYEFIEKQLNVYDFDSNERNSIIITSVIVVIATLFFALCAYIFT